MCRADSAATSDEAPLFLRIAGDGSAIRWQYKMVTAGVGRSKALLVRPDGSAVFAIQAQLEADQNDAFLLSLPADGTPPDGCAQVVATDLALAAAGATVAENSATFDAFDTSSSDTFDISPTPAQAQVGGLCGGGGAAQ